MIDILKKCLFLILIIFFQTAIIPFIRILDVSPDLLLIYLVFESLLSKSKMMILFWFTGGLIQDFSMGGTLGVYALAKTVSGYSTGLFPKIQYQRNIVVLGGVLLLISLMHQIITTLFLTRGAAVGWFPLLLRYGIPSALYTTIVGVAVYFLILKKRKKE